MIDGLRTGEPTLAEAFLAKSPRLRETTLRQYVAELDARLGRLTALLKGEQTPPEVIAAARRFYLDRPFESMRPQAGQQAWRAQWDALVERIGTPQMRARVARSHAREHEQAADITARLGRGEQVSGFGPYPGTLRPSAPLTPEQVAQIATLRARFATLTSSSGPARATGRTDRLLRDVHRATRILRDDPDVAAAYAAASLGTPFEDDPAGQRLAARLERDAYEADLRDAERGKPPPDDGMAEDERIALALQKYWTPARALTRVMRPATRALARFRRAERAVEHAGGRLSQRRALDDLARVRLEWDVAAVLAADLDAERELLRPVIRAAIDGTSRRWRHRVGRVFDEQGVDLYPPCLRSWQVL